MVLFEKTHKIKEEISYIYIIILIIIFQPYLILVLQQIFHHLRAMGAKDMGNGNKGNKKMWVVPYGAIV